MMTKHPAFEYAALALWTIAVLIIGGMADEWYRAHVAEYETQALAERIVQQAAADWDPKVLESYASPNLIRSLQQGGQSLQTLTRIYATLGKLQKFNGCKLSAAGSFLGRPSYSLAEYHCDILTDHAEANMGMVLRKDAGGSWQIVTLSMTSPYFSKLMRSAPAEKEKPATGDAL